MNYNFIILLKVKLITLYNKSANLFFPILLSRRSAISWINFVKWPSRSTLREVNYVSINFMKLTPRGLLPTVVFTKFTSWGWHHERHKVNPQSQLREIYFVKSTLWSSLPQVDFTKFSSWIRPREINIVKWILRNWHHEYSLLYSLLLNRLELPSITRKIKCYNE